MKWRSERRVHRVEPRALSLGSCNDRFFFFGHLHSLIFCFLFIPFITFSYTPTLFTNSLFDTTQTHTHKRTSMTVQKLNKEIANHNYSKRAYKVGGYKTFEEFYPYYLSEHCNTTNRRLHLVGTNVPPSCLMKVGEGLSAGQSVSHQTICSSSSSPGTTNVVAIIAYLILTRQPKFWWVTLVQGKFKRETRSGSPCINSV